MMVSENRIKFLVAKLEVDFLNLCIPTLKDFKNVHNISISGDKIILKYFQI